MVIVEECLCIIRLTIYINPLTFFAILSLNMLKLEGSSFLSLFMSLFLYFYIIQVSLNFKKIWNQPFMKSIVLEKQHRVIKTSHIKIGVPIFS